MSKQPDLGQTLRRQIRHRADPAIWLGEATGGSFKPHGWQLKMLHDNHPRIAGLTPRQSGKRQTIAGKIVHVAKYKISPNGGPTTSIVVAVSDAGHDRAEFQAGEPEYRIWQDNPLKRAIWGR